MIVHVGVSAEGVEVSLDTEGQHLDMTPEALEDVLHRAGRQAVETWLALPDAPEATE